MRTLETPSNQDKRDLVTLVRLVYNAGLGVQNASLKFCTEPIHDYGLFRDALLAIGEYNAFDPAKVAEALKEGYGKQFVACIGRAYSPVLYLHAPQKGWITDPKKIEAHRQVLLATMKRLETLDADALTMVDSTYNELLEGRWGKSWDHSQKSFVDQPWDEKWPTAFVPQHMWGKGEDWDNPGPMRVDHVIRAWWD